MCSKIGTDIDQRIREKHFIEPVKTTWNQCCFCFYCLADVNRKLKNIKKFY